MGTFALFSTVFIFQLIFNGVSNTNSNSSNNNNQNNNSNNNNNNNNNTISNHNNDNYQYDSTCYSSRGAAKQCQPNLQNIAQYGSVKATSTCGINTFTINNNNNNINNKININNNEHSKESFCLHWTNSSRRITRKLRNVSRFVDRNFRTKCFDCSTGRKKRNSYDASVMIDHHIRGNETYWISGQVSNISPYNVVNITLDLNRLFELYYVTLEFCGQPPDGIVFYRSTDYGATYQPWDFFARHCKRLFRMRRTLRSKNPINSVKKKSYQSACYPIQRHLHPVAPNFQMLAFSPMFGRENERTAEQQEKVKKWIGLTNIKLSLIRSVKIRKNATPTRGFDSRFCISDITMGGRLQCYGHAASISQTNSSNSDSSNRQSVKCNCQHDTNGINCDRCSKTHNDAEWLPLWHGISRTGTVCKKCFCNNHSRKCSYNATLYFQSPQGHGSQCIDCQHNTAGPYCDSCSPGYFRNPTLPVTHSHVCQQCNCHSVGSKSRNCNPQNGQCFCKPGVGGKKCNRCMKGYHQTRSLAQPCATDSENKMMATEERCSSCGKKRLRIKFRKYCRKHLMIKISIQSKEIHNSWTRFGVKVLKIWRIDQAVRSKLGMQESGYAIYPIWVANANIRCKCPDFELGFTYLLLTKVKQRSYMNRSELYLNKRSIVLRWRDSWTHRLEKFKQRESEGKCTRFRNKRRRRRRRRRRRPSYYSWQQQQQRRQRQQQQRPN